MNRSPFAPDAVACLDIGSPANGNVGWAVMQRQENQAVHGHDLNALVETLSTRLSVGDTIAIGFECPLYVPQRLELAQMTKARLNEIGVNWCGGPGGSVLATGLVQVNWVLKHLAAKRQGLLATTRWDEFRAGKAKLFIWEAFITRKGGIDITTDVQLSRGMTSHERDALRGVLAFRQVFERGEALNSDLGHEPAISLIGMNLLQLGLSADLSLLSEPCIVKMVRKAA